jgi:hypothetical protein
MKLINACPTICYDSGTFIRVNDQPLFGLGWDYHLQFTPIAPLFLFHAGSVNYQIKDSFDPDPPNPLVRAVRGC